MINKLIELSLRNRFLVVAAFLTFGVWGWWALRATPIDAIPDLSDNQVIVFTDWSGHSPQEVEDQVTYPLTVNLQGLAGVRVVRSQSAFGFSMIYAVFEDDVDLYFARGRVLERLSLVTQEPAAGRHADARPRRHRRRTRLLVHGRESDAFAARPAHPAGLVHPLSTERRARRRRSRLGRRPRPAVPDRRRSEPAAAVRLAAQRGRGRRPRQQRQRRRQRPRVERRLADRARRRPRWLRRRREEDRRRRVSGRAGVRRAAWPTCKIGNAFRVASLVKGAKEAVGGVVVARTGVNTKALIDAVKARIAQIEPGLPPGVKIVPFYDRSTLIEQAIDTLRHALVEEILLVTLAHVVFLMHFRSILIVTIPLPLAVLLSFLGMYYAGISSNIMSLAGIAIAIGVLVDAGIVVTENAFRFMEQRAVDPRDRRLVWQTVLESTRLVGRPVFFSMAIILLAFIPVFALAGQEGKLFHPLAFTKTFAVLAATVIAVTLVPVLCSLLLGGKVHKEDDNPVMRGLRRLYRPALAAALTHRVVTVSGAALLFVGALFLARGIGSEFMPPLNEGDLMFMPIADPSISLEENTRIAAKQNAILQSFPEVAYAVAKVARADTSTDPAPLNMTETVVHLKPREQWRAGMTLDRLRAEMGRAVQMPGVSNIWTMPIINRIDMLTTGIRSEVGVKVFGTDLARLEGLAREVADVLRGVRGASNVYPEQVTSGQYLNIAVDRAAAARYGIGVGDVQEVIETAIGEDGADDDDRGPVAISGARALPA